MDAGDSWFVGMNLIVVGVVTSVVQWVGSRFKVCPGLVSGDVVAPCKDW